MLKYIRSVAFSRDNQSAFISDETGHIKLIKWQAGANSGDDFDFSEEPKKVGNNGIGSICLTKDEKYLLFGSYKAVHVFETTKRFVLKEFKMASSVISIDLIKGGKRAIIADNNGDLTCIDLETMEMSSIAKNITNGQDLYKIIVI